MADFLTSFDWRSLAAISVCLLACLVVAFLYRRVHRQKVHFETALNNMSEGLCMFDASTRLILCNERYIEMYGLPPEMVKPGVMLRELLVHRIRAGAFTGDPDEYIAEMLERMKGRQVVQDVKERPGGIFVSVSSRPMAGGGWVATHQDITERRRQDQQRERLAAQEHRRAAIDDAIAAVPPARRGDAARWSARPR